MKKATVIYDTRFGNTDKIAEASALGMEEQGVKVDCYKVEEVEINRLSEYDFAGNRWTNLLPFLKTSKYWMDL